MQAASEAVCTRHVLLHTEEQTPSTSDHWQLIDRGSKSFPGPSMSMRTLRGSEYGSSSSRMKWSWQLCG